MIAFLFIDDILWKQMELAERLPVLELAFLPKTRAMPWKIDVCPSEGPTMKRMVFELTASEPSILRYDLVDIISTQEMKVHLLITGGRFGKEIKDTSPNQKA